jgi:hypothetical protein
MGELHVIGALRNKRAELAGTLRQLEQQLVQQRASLAHLDAKAVQRYEVTSSDSASKPLSAAR